MSNKKETKEEKDSEKFNAEIKEVYDSEVKDPEDSEIKEVYDSEVKDPEDSEIKEVYTPENFNSYILTINILQALIIVISPLLFYLFKEDFLFFMPLILFIIIRFNKIRKTIKKGTTSKEIVNMIKNSSILIGGLWFFETLMYILAIFFL